MLYLYVVCLTFGILFSLVSFLLGHNGFNFFGADVDACGNVFTPVNSLVLSSAIITFGATGIIGKVGLDIGDIAGVLVSIGVAGVVGIIVYFGNAKFMYSSQSNSTFLKEDIIGLDGEVLTTIPQNGVGEIGYVINGERHSLPARTYSGKKADRGETLIINEMAGKVAMVSRKFNLEDIVIPDEYKENKEELDDQL